MSEISIGISLFSQQQLGAGGGPPPTGANELVDTEGTPNIMVDTEGTPNNLTDTE